MNKIIVLVSLIFLIASCKHDSLIEEMPEKIDCNNGEVDFVNQILPILQTSCATSGCHDESSARDGVILSSYDKIIATGEVNAGNANSSELYEVLNETGSDMMPPLSSGISISQTQKDLIKNWINQGAKNVACNTITNTCDSTEVSFSNTVVPLLEASCVGCHTGSTAAGSVWLDNYNDIKVVALDGSLLGSIEHLPNYEAMPISSPKWDDCKIAIIENWIAEGALKN